MHKFKVGDKVRIRPDLKEGKCGSNTVVDDMLKWRGKVVTVEDVSDQGHDIKLNGRLLPYHWTDEMLQTVNMVRDKKRKTVKPKPLKAEVIGLDECRDKLARIFMG